MSAIPDEPERLVRDIYPAEILLPSGTLLRDVRCFITTRRLIAYQTGPKGIAVALEVPVAQPVTVPASRGTLQGRLEVHLDYGGTAWVNRGRGCGCGSPLKMLGLPVGWTGNQQEAQHG